MADLQKFHAKLCLTATGFLVHKNTVLLVKHKKLGIWLAPGGHVEKNELPHSAAEREFWEETGVKVRAIQQFPFLPSIESEYVPSPFCINLHWVAKENYTERLKSNRPHKRVKTEKWKRGCEQHYSLNYLVQPTEKHVTFKQNVEETDGIGWFHFDEVKDLETTEDIKNEVEYALRLNSKI